MRNEGRAAAGRLKPIFKFWEVTFTQTLRLTRHLREVEVQVLHAHGKVPLRKVTCEKEDGATRQEKGRKGERRR